MVKSHHTSILLLLLSTLFLSLFSPSHAQQQQDPSTLNGGSILAMAGNDCVALAVDKRFGSGPALVNVQPRAVLWPSPRVMVAFTGLEGDVQSLRQELAAQVAVKYGNDSDSGSGGGVSPRAILSLVSHVLYARKNAPYYVEPIVVGLDNDTTPLLCSLDMIGAKSTSRAFCCSGAATKSLYGTAEALWRPGLEPDELVEVIGKAFLSALERDCLSGYGAIVYLITRDGVTEYDLAGRED